MSCGVSAGKGNKNSEDKTEVEKANKKELEDLGFDKEQIDVLMNTQNAGFLELSKEQKRAMKQFNATQLNKFGKCWGVFKNCDVDKINTIAKFKWDKMPNELYTTGNVDCLLQSDKAVLTDLTNWDADYLSEFLKVKNVCSNIMACKNRDALGVIKDFGASKLKLLNGCFGWNIAITSDNKDDVIKNYKEFKNWPDDKFEYVAKHFQLISQASADGRLKNLGEWEKDKLKIMSDLLSDIIAHIPEYIKGLGCWQKENLEAMAACPDVFKKVLEMKCPGRFVVTTLNQLKWLGECDKTKYSKLTDTIISTLGSEDNEAPFKAIVNGL